MQIHAVLQSRFAQLTACLLLLLGTYLVYQTGMGGGFLFDDVSNLSAIGAFGPVDDWRTLLYYLTSGTADPTGRPVALLTFLLDATDWPADPLPFKRTNVLLHLINGALLIAAVYRLERRIGGRTGPPWRTAWIALLAGGLWLLHPLHVSTTLYIVQRHAMLPLTFTLLGFLAWDYAWGTEATRPRVRSIVFGILSVWTATLLAGLSKANGFLLPLLLLIATWLFYRIGASPSSASDALAVKRRKLRRWMTILALVLPGIAVLALLLLQWPRSLDWQPYNRDWTIAERLLTQPRVLFDYLSLLFIPQQATGGIFVDSFQASRGLFQPWTTAIALAGLLTLGCLAIGFRRRFPTVSFALMFFFTAHVVESSFIALELYFEHRNYLPSAFLFWPIARWLIGATSLTRVRISLAVVLPIALALLTLARASLWGNPDLQLALWGLRNTASERSQIVAAQGASARGDVAAALAGISEAQRAGPDLSLAIARINIECRLPDMSEDALGAVESALARNKLWSAPYYAWLRDLLHAAETHRCPALADADVDRLFASVQGNTYAYLSDVRKKTWFNLQGTRELDRGNEERALEWFNRALLIDGDPEQALVQAAQLGNASLPQLGLAHLDTYDALNPTSLKMDIRDMASLHAWLLHRKGYYEGEVRHLRRALREAQHQSPNASEPSQ